MEFFQKAFHKKLALSTIYHFLMYIFLILKFMETYKEAFQQMKLTVHFVNY